jgi:hypothetical protein
MGKYVLEVNKRTTNLAIYGELGRYPLYILTLLFNTQTWNPSKGVDTFKYFILSIKTPITEQYHHDYIYIYRHYDFNDYKINLYSNSFLSTEYLHIKFILFSKSWHRKLSLLRTDDRQTKWRLGKILGLICFEIAWYIACFLCSLERWSPHLTLSI